MSGVESFAVRASGRVCCILVDPSGFAFGFGCDRVVAHRIALAAFVEEYHRQPATGRGHAHYVTRPTPWAQKRSADHSGPLDARSGGPA